MGAKKIVVQDDSFENLKTTRRGNAGEDIVKEFLKEKGWFVFGRSFVGAYPVDGLALRPKDGGFDLIAFEAKTYPRLFSCSQTGVDMADYYTYQEIAQVIPLTIIFVDAFERCSYALSFREHLEKGVPKNGKVYFELELMKKLRVLTKAQLNSIGWIETANYRNVKRFFNEL